MASGDIEAYRAIPRIFSLYVRLFRNPAAVVFLALFLIVYGIVIFVVTSREEVSFIELVKAAPFAVSAVVLGAFSVLFWALNYVGRAQKIELRVKEAEELFRIRKNLLDEVFNEAAVESSLELSAVKAHLLLAGGEISAEPETPGSKLGFEYSDAVKALLRRA
ncbi:hypothetical protein ACM26W_06535 [Halomonas sp. HK25]|uniref:hypothetical protein n=1 Tax=Halomonas sp. HK25 TaxID=3394321 RepID=UPI0039FDB610